MQFIAWLQRHSSKQKRVTLDKWIFSLKLRNSAGVLSSLTALFADRGVSIESLSAHAGGGPSALPATAVLTFEASEARKAHLARLLGRLESVLDLAEYRYDDDAHARKSTLARVPLSAAALSRCLPPGILCDIVSADAASTLALLVGPAASLDLFLAANAGNMALEERDATVFVV